MFKRGDYIVQLYTDDGSGQFAQNYIYKQKEYYSYLLPELDLKGSTTNGWSAISFNSAGTWRFATPKEIIHYELIGRPYDVTTLSDQNSEVSLLFKCI